MRRPNLEQEPDRRHGVGKLYGSVALPIEERDVGCIVRLAVAAREVSLIGSVDPQRCQVKAGIPGTDR